MEPLIQLRNLEKVYEAGRQQVLRPAPCLTWIFSRANSLHSWALRARESPRCLASSECSMALGRGEYYFNGEPVHRLNVKKRNELHKANIGFVFQSYHLIDNLTVFENLEIPLSYKNVPHKERVSLVCDILDRFNIVGKKDLVPQPALRRAAAACGRRARGDPEPQADSGRRTHGQSSLRARRRNHGTFPKAE